MLAGTSPHAAACVRLAGAAQPLPRSRGALQQRARAPPCRCEHAAERLSRRSALAGAAALPSLLSLAAANARGLENYVKTPKPKQPPELLAAATLVAREVLVQFERTLRNTAVEVDAGDLRALLRAGPFRKFRDALRQLARVLPDPAAGARDADECFKRLEMLDITLTQLAKTEDAAAAAPLRAESAEGIASAITALDTVLAQLPADTMEAARAALV